MKLELTIPTSQKEITVEQWIKLDNDVKTIENQLALRFMIVSNLCNIKIEELMKLQPQDVMDVYDQLKTVINEMPEETFRFTIDGVEYGLIPDFDKISSNEYLDLNAYFGKDIQRTMAILFRPIKNKNRELYSIEPYEGSDKYFNEMLKAPASAYTTATVFFYSLGNELLTYMTESLAEKLTAEELTLLYRNGVGIYPLMQLPEVTEQSLLKLQN